MACFFPDIVLKLILCLCCDFEMPFLIANVLLVYMHEEYLCSEIGSIFLMYYIARVCWPGVVAVRMDGSFHLGNKESRDQRRTWK